MPFRVGPWDVLLLVMVRVLHAEVHEPMDPTDFA
jgi:hypothetical protein